MEGLIVRMDGGEGFIAWMQVGWRGGAQQRKKRESFGWSNIFQVASWYE